MTYTYWFLCGNLDCATRLSDPPTWYAVSEEDTSDGEVWLCDKCRAVTDLVKRSTESSGVPERLEDPAAAEQIARILK